MKTVQQQLQDAVNSATAHLDTTSVSADALAVVPCANAQFGDYQWNGALPLAKTLKQNPRALAQSILEKLDVSGMSETPEIAGPGFLNFRLTDEFLACTARTSMDDPRLGASTPEKRRTFVVDFSSPNVAKPMHVGHIRSTILGDAIARLLRFAGHKVITDNHIGDWGTQFGKMIIGWKNHLDHDALGRDPIAEMERIYKIVNAASESDPKVAEEARAETAKLQKHEHPNIDIWKELRDLSQAQFDQIYGRLNVSFDEVLGESFYTDRLQSVVGELKAKGLARESEGAVIVEFDEPQLRDKPLLIQKSDGSALYGTTDLATIQFRVETWQPDEIVYVVDARQSLHFQQLFKAAQMWGYDVSCKHVAFGAILGEDNRPIKTRSGETIKLRDLLDEADTRALEIVREKNPALDEITTQNIARVVGIGSVKYADLAQNRTSDYVFSWDKMLAMNGNTAPYLLNAYVRIRSIFRRVESECTVFSPPDQLHLEHSAERALAEFLLRFGLAIENALADYRLNALTDYLFELAHKFHNFYENCPVLTSDEPLRSSRLALCLFTADVLARGLDLLGIETIEQM